MTTLNKRLFLGILIMCLIIIVCCLIGFVSNFKNTNILTNFDNKPNETFTQEVVDISVLGGTNIQCEKNGNVVGFNLPYKNTYSFDVIKKNLEDHDWKYVNSGRDDLASFYKTSGNYKWLLLNCVDIASQTSVVMTLD